MIRGRLQHDPIQRAGFSLIELLIVLGIMVVLAGLATPSLISRMQDNRVFRAGETVRETLAESRSFAVDSGVDYQFRYVPGGQFFVVIPAELEPSNANSVFDSEATSDVMRLSGELSEELTVSAMPDAEDLVERLDPEWFGALPDSVRLSQQAWSGPILFRFDGTAEDGTFRVSDAEGRTVEISVRGLTGSVSMSQVYQEIP